MAITTYAELKSAVADWLNRTDLTARVPDFIRTAEASIGRTLRHNSMLVRDSITLDSRYVALPADFLEAYRLEVTDSPASPVEMADPDELVDLRYSRGTSEGRPAYYAVLGSEIELYPVPPSTGYTGEIVYYGAITALSADGDTNWLLTGHPDLYLYGTLLAAEPYLKNDGRLAIWSGLYDRALVELNTASERAQVSGTGLRMRMRTRNG